MAVNWFDGNNEIYVHLNCKQKSVSMMLSDFEEVCGVYDTLKQKLHLLQQEGSLICFIHSNYKNVKWLNITTLC